MTFVGPAKRSSSRIRAVAATVRMANLPSVASNVLLGVLPGYLMGSGVDAAARVPVVLVAAFCLYLSGGFLNDWADRRWDAARRPERALPRGLFAPPLYLAVGIALALGGMMAAAFASTDALVVAAAITLNIGIYTWLHKKSAASAVFMGLCRGLLPVLGWAAVGGDLAWLPVVFFSGTGLLCHVAGISLLARRESLARIGHRICPAGGCFLGSMLAMMAAMRLLEIPAALLLLGCMPYLMWTACHLARRMEMASRVSGLLAGIPWVDWMLLLPLALTVEPAPPEVWQAGLAWLPPLAVLAGKVLQRLAPAT